MARVVVGLSGGVDSSVAAWLLQQEGHEVIGIFMRNWHDDTVILDDECPWIEDSNDALAVAESLGIPFQVMDLSIDYKERIVDYMFDEYAKGRTPNPDVLCNREIKFDLFLKAAMQLNADFVATGHYCQKRVSTDDKGQEVFHLVAGADNSKDQSYFLCQLNQYQLSKALFPIGGLQKSQVRKIAAEAGLLTAEKKDSQGLCFIGKVKLPIFLQQQLEPKKGAIVEISKSHEIYQSLVPAEPTGDLTTWSKKRVYTSEMGTIVGEHHGAHYFTIGQRKGLNVGGKVEPLFVIDTDVDENIVYVGEGQNHPGLYRKALRMEESETHWVNPNLKLQVGDQRSFLSRIRYRQALVKADLLRTADGYYLIFEEPQRGVAAGQFAAWYLDDELVGSGVIA